MLTDKSLNSLSEYQKSLGSRIFDLVIAAVLERACLNFTEEEKKNMERIFLSGDNKDKEDFIKKNIPDFKTLFAQEAEKVEEEIKVELEKQA